MKEQPSPNYSGLMLAAVLLSATGCGGLALLLTGTRPTLGPRWLFFFLGTAGTTGIALPFLWLLNKRFHTSTPAMPLVLLRRGLFVGLYAAVCIWLEMNRMLNLSLALLLGLGLIGIEWFLHLVERSIWRPGK